MTFKHASSLLLNAIDRSHLSLYFDLVYTLVFALSIVITAPKGILPVAIAVLIVNIIFSASISIFSIKKAFSKI